MSKTLFAAAAVLGAALPVSAQETPDRTGTTGTTQQSAPAAALSQIDRQFVQKAAIGGLAEVELGRLAAKNGQSQAVRAFGQKMVDDHSRANEELKRIALRLNAQVPRELDQEHKQVKDKLSRLQGAEFDKAYLEAMQKDHRKTLELFQRQVSEGKSTELQSFAQKTLPVLEQHHEMVEQLVQAQAGSSASSM